MFFEQVLPEIRKGGGARRSEWISGSHIALGIYKTRGETFIYFYPVQIDSEKHPNYPLQALGGYRLYDLFTSDILATDWEIYSGPVRYINKP